MFEGCLSFPGVTIPVIRTCFNKIRAKWTTINGKVVEERTSSVTMARCILHEIDHLDGSITFDQHVSPMVWTKKQFDKAKKETDA